MTTTQPEVSRRNFLRIASVAGAGMFLVGEIGGRPFRVPMAAAAIPGGTLAPGDIPKFQTPLLVPPAMPRAGTIRMPGGKNADYYEISMRQFAQQVLPADLPATTLWGYGAVKSENKKGLLLHNAPSLTIEAEYNRPVRIKWINSLVDRDTGHYLQHLLPVDPTLHWANPPGGMDGRDTRPAFTGGAPGPYEGPVPIVTHVHGAIGVGDESDGYTEAWYLPDATDIPDEYATEGTWYDFFGAKAGANYGDAAYAWGPGFAIFEYPNLGRASTDWYHDHALGMTRLNVYAGPAGFYNIRGGPHGDKAVLDGAGNVAVLPGPAPRDGDKFPPNKPYREIALAIQDRSFNSDGSLFYPDTRAFFDEITGPYLGEDGGVFPPYWNPEFFGNTIIVNGNTWPYLDVEPRRYRFRVLNGCQSRFLILDFNAIPGVKVHAIGNEGGFLAAPVDLTATNGNRLLMALAERADLIVDFAGVAPGNYVLKNVGPDEPFGGGVPDGDFDSADPDSTGQVMQFRVLPGPVADDTTPPDQLVLPALAPLPPETFTRRLALIEVMGHGTGGEGEGPVEALLGTVDGDGHWHEYQWMEEVTENPQAGAVEVWELYNTTGDAHPMHIHEIAFEVVSRQDILVDEDDHTVALAVGSDPLPPESWETGVKDTVTAYPGQVTRVKAHFMYPGQFVWHCHIVEHEDNEMMRPFRIGPIQVGQPPLNGS